MIEGLKPSEFRQQQFAQRGKTSFLPHEHRYDRDAQYAFKIDSRVDHNYAAFVICKLVDVIESKVATGQVVTTKDLDAWHIDYAKTGFRAAGMAPIAIALANDPVQALGMMKSFLMTAPVLPGVPIPGAYFMSGQ
jgi:hypothetical protein